MFNMFPMMQNQSQNWMAPAGNFAQAYQSMCQNMWQSAMKAWTQPLQAHMPVQAQQQQASPWSPRITVVTIELGDMTQVMQPMLEAWQQMLGSTMTSFLRGRA